MNVFQRAFISCGSRGYLNWIPDATYLKILYNIRTGKKLDLKNPRSFNEKLQWLKIHNRCPEFTRMVDKYEAKSFVAERLGEEYVIPALGVWERFEDIDFDSLPDQFVLKCTHDSGGLVICRDKSQFDKEAARKKIERSLKQNYYWGSREWPYKDVKPRILAEEYVEDAISQELRDYKLFAFNGDVKVFYITSGRKAGDRRTDYFDMTFNHLDIQDDDPNAESCPAMPKNFQRMKQIAEELSRGIPHLRVDFYEVNGKIYVGELTFFYLSGFVPFKPEKWNNVFGEWIDLSIIKERAGE